MNRCSPNFSPRLRRGGSLAVQVPDNLDEPAHRIMREVAAAGPWAAKLTDASSARAARRGAGWYYSLLHGCGVSVDIWRTTYYHLLAGGAAAITEWFKGTGLRPFLQPLNEDEAHGYLARYEACVAQAYPAMPDGAVLLPFPDLPAALVLARRAAAAKAERNARRGSNAVCACCVPPANCLNHVCPKDAVLSNLSIIVGLMRQLFGRDTHDSLELQLI